MARETLLTASHVLRLASGHRWPLHAETSENPLSGLAFSAHLDEAPVTTRNWSAPPVANPIHISDRLADGRQSTRALDLQRGVIRVLAAHGFAPLTEFNLKNGRRADVAGINDKGIIWIVEIKSTLADFRTDQKWPEYRAFCDAFFFAVAADFPSDVLTEDTGLILADRFGGDVICMAPDHKLAAPRRKAVTLSFARASAQRLASATFPDLSGDANPFRALG